MAWPLWAMTSSCHGMLLDEPWLSVASKRWCSIGAKNAQCSTPGLYVILTSKLTHRDVKTRGKTHEHPPFLDHSEGKPRNSNSCVNIYQRAFRLVNFNIMITFQLYYYKLWNTSVLSLWNSSHSHFPISFIIPMMNIFNVYNIMMMIIIIIKLFNYSHFLFIPISPVRIHKVTTWSPGFTTSWRKRARIWRSSSSPLIRAQQSSRRSGGGWEDDNHW